MFALEFAGASKRYGPRTALEGLDLAVPEGAAVGLLGPNGAGKTTALRLLLGFTRPSGGAVRLRGRDPFDPAARVGVGYLPECLPAPQRMSVRGFLRLHAALAGQAGESLVREVDAALERTGLGPRASVVLKASSVCGGRWDAAGPRPRPKRIAWCPEVGKGIDK